MGFDLLPNTPHRYTLRQDQGKPDAAVWLLRALPSRVLLVLGQIGEDQPAVAAAAMLEAGLVGVEGGGLTRGGQPFQFVAAGRRMLHGIEVTGGATGELLDMLPAHVITELAGELMRINRLDLESAKN